MPAYINILKSDSIERKQRWLIAGANTAMIQDATDLAEAHVSSGEFSIAKSVYFGDSASTVDLIKRLSTPTVEDRSLVILFDAEKYGEWPALAPHLKKMSSQHFFIAVSNDKSIDKSSLAYRLFVGDRKAHFVECKEMSIDDYLIWIDTKIKIDRAASRLLVSKSNGDSEWLLNWVKKLQFLSLEEINIEVVESLVKDEGSSSFEVSLLYHNKKNAIKYLLTQGTSDIDMYSIVEALRKACLVYEASKVAGRNKRELHDRTNVNPKNLAGLRALGKRYGRSLLFTNLSLLFARSNYLFPIPDKRSALAVVERW